MLFIAVLSAASGSAGSDGGARDAITVADISKYTDPQFQALVAGAGGDRKKIEAVDLTQQLFTAAVNDKTQVPEGSTFDRGDVKKVGRNVGRILQVVAQYQKRMALADTKEKAKAAQDELVAAAREISKQMPTARASGGASSGQGGERRGGADLGVIAMHAANQAYQEVEGIGGDQPPGGHSGGVAGGAAPNGSDGGAPSGGQTIGGLLGFSNPNSPIDAMTDARERYRGGDIPGGIEDASRAIDLGGGAAALALRGGMQMDQKQYSQAAQDARDALQLDPSNKEALTVEHFSEGRIDGVASSGPPGAPAGRSVSGAGASSDGGGGASDGDSSNDGPAGRAGNFSGSIGLPMAAASGGLSSVQAQKAAQGALGMNDLGGAMAIVNRALAQDPRDPALLNLRSSIYARGHDYARARADARAGLASAPKDSALLRSLGFAQLREKDYRDALATANEMLELDSNDPYAYALRGHAYGSLGDREAMMADLQRAAELDPSFARAAAQMASRLQLPEDKDILFLFPGEESPAAPKTAEPAIGRSRTFGLIVAASSLGGLLLALALLHTVLAPFKEHLASAITRITRAGRAVGAAANDDAARPAAVKGRLSGTILGQYEVSRQIGVGGMGMVFAGTDRSLGRPVAIKKMREELRYDAREKARFVAEARTVAALHHPNIVDIYAIAEDGDDVFLIFEYVDGMTIHELLQASGRLEPERAAKLVRMTADALEYAHSRDVIHRDMKPSNVMLDQSGRVKVMDFGIARMAKDTMLRHSMTNTVVGTPPYMAPEQEQGHVRRESDVYALAVCAYEMLCGKLPFAGIGGGMLLNKINMRYAAPARAIPGLPGPLDAVFAKAFQADPDKRYRTPKEFAAALESALSGNPRASSNAAG